MSEVAKMDCLSGWVVLYQEDNGYRLRIWSKENGEDGERFEKFEANKAIDRYEASCLQLLREMRP